MGVRFAQYADLTLLFGMALFGVLSSPEQRQFLPARTIALAAALAGLALTMLGTLVVAAGMAGVTPGNVDAETLSLVLFETPTGAAALVRGGALGIALGVALLWRRQDRNWYLATALVSGVALATLAWTGHAAVSEGLTGVIHRASDIVHLLAASAWLGALAGLFLLLLAPADAMGIDRLDGARRALDAFSVTGSVIVGLIVVTGLANSVLILGFDNLAALFTSLWGQLLLVKILLFGIMLGFAAANRYRFVPGLERALKLNDSTRAVQLLRISLLLETGVAVAILALVAWLGTLSPTLTEM
ncbi:copper homeostasis membrane protein CopD [Sphingomonas koreensis]|uniref:copper homeostasis membrane protein CopD n=1 Tax=Sphingomonas koreensis TaxID=93064 RepID=UPI00082EB493|nr:copper homeostasis membrane protein CopD [Sphingomonas koreensis]